MTEVLVLGQPFWGTHIAVALNSSTTDLRATFVPQQRYARLLLRPPHADRVVIMRVGYRMGATTPRGRLFDAYWALLCRSMPRSVRCHYWLGTDVLDTIEDARAGKLRREALSSTRDDLHLTVAPWLTTELEEVGIHATTAPIPELHHAPDVVAPLPDDFSTLAYVPDHRFDFFGGPVILEAARQMPDVRFDVVGGKGEGRPSAANVVWHGWVTNMPDRYAATTAVVRIPRHDGFGGTVVEGLLHARHVVYTNELPHVRRIWPVTPEALVSVLSELRAAHRAGVLRLNLEGRAYALDAFDAVDLIRCLAELLETRP